jgi:hypothetical protein
MAKKKAAKKAARKQTSASSKPQPAAKPTPRKRTAGKQPRAASGEKREKPADSRRSSLDARNSPAEARIERALTARLKLARGESLSAADSRDIDWLRERDSREALESWKAAIPKGEYCQLAGRQHKLINDAAERYELPLKQPTIDLQAAITGLHDVISQNARAIRAGLDGQNINELREEKLKQEILKLEKENDRMAIELEYTRGNAIPRAQVRESLVVMTARLRTLGQTLNRIHPDARDALNNTLDGIASEVEQGQLKF